jgi:hypothetical protein
MLFEERARVYSENYTKLINTKILVLFRRALASEEKRVRIVE